MTALQIGLIVAGTAAGAFVSGGRYLGKSEVGRRSTNAYLRQIATTAAEYPGYDGLLIPTGSGNLDPIVTGAWPDDRARDGVFQGHDERDESADEFWTIWQKVLEGETVTLNGKYYHLDDETIAAAQARRRASDSVCHTASQIK